MHVCECVWKVAGRRLFDIPAYSKMASESEAKLITISMHYLKSVVPKVGLRAPRGCEAKPVCP